MSGIHRSKEVYKYTDTPTGRKLVPVRGMYVSGLHTEPWYIDHTVSVSRFTSNEPTIMDYYESSYDNSIGGLHFVGVNSYEPTLQRFTTQHTSGTFTGLHFVGVNSYDCVLYKYQTFRTDASFGGLHFVGVADFGNVQCYHYTKKTVDSSLEHMISVLKYESSNPTIENIN